MDNNRLKELDRIYDMCTEWLNENPNANLESWRFVSDQRLAALKEQTEIFNQQLINAKKNNGKIH